MFRRLKRLLLERYILPKAFEAFENNPAQLAEFLSDSPEAKNAILHASLSSRGVAQSLVARLQDLLLHTAGNASLQEAAARAITSVLIDDTDKFAPLARQLAATVTGERRLVQTFLHHSGPLLIHARGNSNLEGIVASEVAHLATESVSFQNLLRASLHGTQNWRVGVVGDHALMSRMLGGQGVADWGRMEAWVAWHLLLGRLGPWLGEGDTFKTRNEEGALRLKSPNDLRLAFYETFCDNSELPLQLGRVRLPDDHSFWPQLYEIFVNEDYAFKAATDAPRIIDAGMHMGLATYFFKSRYPKATIIGFEPSPALREVVTENVARCGFENVTIEPFALYEHDATLQFHIDADDTMAGSLLSTHHAEDAHSGYVEVEARRLSPYLAEPVDYLKLDIEGAEGGVLLECREMLGNVCHLFIEYHEEHAPEVNSLPTILGLLDAAGFDYEVSKSHGYQLLTGKSPMQHVGRPYSAIIWAKNRVWPPAGTV